jgi:serine protease Do
MATAVNPSTSAGISIGSAVGSVGEWLRQITVRVNGSRNSHGSGVIWHSEGLILTNAHVADWQVHEIELVDGRRSEGWVVARDPKIDLAALAVSASDLPVARTRDARTLRPGEVVIAVGNPSDDVGAVVTGIVHHAVGKLPWLVADVRLAPGHSGGPLADANGNVVGINSMIVGGLGWAVTSNAVQAFLQRMKLAEVV